MKNYEQYRPPSADATLEATGKQNEKQFGQSVAHYTSQAKLWALRGCESTNKTVGRDYLHTLLNE